MPKILFLLNRYLVGLFVVSVVFPTIACSVTDVVYRFDGIGTL